MPNEDKLPAAAVSRPPCECWYIAPLGPLDGIHVFWLDFAPGQGSVTITCWGQAWSAYFGGMGTGTIKDFFASCDTGYMVTKLGITPMLKHSKRNDAYVGRIVDAVRSAVKQGALASATPQAEKEI